MTVEKKSVQTTHQRVRPDLRLRDGWTVGCCVPVNGFISSRHLERASASSETLAARPSLQTMPDH